MLEELTQFESQIEELPAKFGLINGMGRNFDYQRGKLRFDSWLTRYTDWMLNNIPGSENDVASLKSQYHDNNFRPSGSGYGTKSQMVNTVFVRPFTNRIDSLREDILLGHFESVHKIDPKSSPISKEYVAQRWARSEAKSVDITKHKFDVAFSFPGEARSYVESIAAELERQIGPNSYFYDNNYKAQLARPSLDLLLQDIYRNRSKLVVVFLCEKYQEKTWCGIEFKAIREILAERKDEKIMYVKMDDDKVDGVFSIDGYIDGTKHTSKEIAEFIQERVSLLP
jgi:hypothetical protein